MRIAQATFDVLVAAPFKWHTDWAWALALARADSLLGVAALLLAATAFATPR